MALKQFNVRISEQDYERVAALRDWLQEKSGRYVAVTDRTVFLRALDALESERREKDRKR